MRKYAQMGLWTGLVLSIALTPVETGAQKGSRSRLMETKAPSQPPRNPFLSAAKYGTTHSDPAQTDAFPYPAPRGIFNVDLRRVPRVAGGPVNYMQLASTSPQYMWATSTGGVNYVDVSNGGFRSVAGIASPGAKDIPNETLDKVLAARFTSLAQVENAVMDELGADWTRLAANVYSFVDRDNVLYANAGVGLVHAYALVDTAKPAAGIKVVRTLDFSDELKQAAKGGGPSMETYGARIVGLNLTYDGQIVILTNRSVTVMGRDFQGEQHTVEFGNDEYVSNSMAVDENNGIYVASDKLMHKLVWTGAKLSNEGSDGAWSAPYDTGREPPNVKFGSGAGSTPTLMGFGSDPDKLVVITDGADRMKLVAFWRDKIPDAARRQPGAMSTRIAGQIQVTCGLIPPPEFIQSEQSVVVNGYGAFVVNNIRRGSAKDRLIDVLAGGPVFAPPAGVERLEWNPQTHAWHSVWTRRDVVGTSMVPAVSSTSNIAFVNGYTHMEGWELTGLDWMTGKTVHRTLFGQDNLGNGAYALIQFLPNGDLLFNSIGGPARVHYTQQEERSRAIAR
jgi:hypothetical protein